MKQIVHPMRSILLAAALAAGLSSCVREDTGDCPPPVERSTLEITFSYAPTDIPLAPEDLHRAAVYFFFNSPNELCHVWTIDNPRLGTVYDTGIALDPTKDYEVIVWINPDAPYVLTPPYGDPVDADIVRTEARLALDIPADGTVTEALPWLLFGSAEIADPLPGTRAALRDTIVDIPLTLDNYLVELAVDGLPDDGGEYAFRISDNNGVYDFYNNFAPAPSLTYQSTARVVDGKLTFSLDMLRLDITRSPQISLVNLTTGATLYPQRAGQTTNLVDLIGQRGGNTDFDTRHEYDLRLVFGGDDAAVIKRLF